MTESARSENADLVGALRWAVRGTTAAIVPGFACGFGVDSKASKYSVWPCRFGGTTKNALAFPSGSAMAVAKYTGSVTPMVTPASRILPRTDRARPATEASVDSCKPPAIHRPWRTITATPLRASQVFGQNAFEIRFAGHGKGLHVRWLVARCQWAAAMGLYGVNEPFRIPNSPMFRIPNSTSCLVEWTCRLRVLSAGGVSQRRRRFRNCSGHSRFARFACTWPMVAL